MTLVRLVDFIEAATATMAAGRLLTLGLARRQSALLAFLLFFAAGSFTLSALPASSAAYFWVYITVIIVNWGLSTNAVREIFALALESYPGIRTASNYATYGAISIAVAGSLFVTNMFWRGGAHGRSNFFYVMAVNRSIVLTLAAVLIAILIFLSRYPLHLQRNTYVSCTFFGAALISQAVVHLIDSLGRNLYFELADSVQVVFSAACFAGWALFLRPATEAIPARVTYETPREHELLLQLESLNSLLARAGRR